MDSQEILNNFTSETYEESICTPRWDLINQDLIDDLNDRYNYKKENIKFNSNNFPFYTIPPQYIDNACNIINVIRKEDNTLIEIRCKFDISQISQNMTFENITFKRNIFSTNSDIKHSIIFKECTFENQVKFINTKFKNFLSFEECTFNNDFLIQNCSLNNFNFTRCCFGKENSNTDPSYVLENCAINEDSDFSESIFNSKVNFHKVIFKRKSSFSNTSFNKLVDFFKSEFHKPTLFYKTDFFDRAFIGNVTFNDGVNFLYTRVSVNTIISFESSIFKNGIDISRANFLCPVQFWGISGFDLRNIDKILDCNIYRNVKENEDHIIVCKRIRESFRHIKNSFRLEGNNIEALSFQRYEMMIYERELKIINKQKNQISLRKILLKKYKIIKNSICTIFNNKYRKFKESEDNNNINSTKIALKDILYINENSIALKLNRYSNNYGTSWKRGIIFTVATSLISYIILLSSYNEKLNFNPYEIEPILNFTKYWLQLFNIANWKISPFGCTETPLAYIILFICRIVIGYGIYQTVQAFRKYGKN